MKKLTGLEIVKILINNYTNGSIGHGAWKDFRKESEFYKSEIKISKDEYLISLGLGTIEDIEQIGGKGEGQYYYQVWYFKDHNVYIRIEGDYYSYDGVYWDCEPKVVTKKEKTIFVYE